MSLITTLAQIAASANVNGVNIPALNEHIAAQEVT